MKLMAHHIFSLSATHHVPHEPAQEWSYRIPALPYISIPNPAFNRGGESEIHLDRGGPIDFEASGFKNYEFLKTITFSTCCEVPGVTPEWKYEQRWTAQRILPFLYLGPFSAAKDAAFLHERGITMVLTVRDTLLAKAKLLRLEATDLGVESKTLDVAGSQGLIAAFSRGIEMINTHLQAMESRPHGVPGAVFVSCETGNDRSALMVAAYIMAMFSMSFVHAIQIVQAQRFAAIFDDSARNLLQAFNEILQAKRDVFQACSGEDKHGQDADFGRTDGIQTALAVRKRTLDNIDAEDMELDMDEDGRSTIQRARRQGQPPFCEKCPP